MAEEKEGMSIEDLMLDLKIPTERHEELLKIFIDSKKVPEGTLVNALKFFIRSVNKANELSFLSFVAGMTVGQGMIAMEIPGLIKQAAHIGAVIAQQNAESGEAPPAMTAEQKKKEKHDEIMYQ